MKYIITALVLAISITAFGQFTKGDKALGGTIFVNARNGTNSNNTQKSSSYSFSPRFGAFLNPSVEVGGELGLSSNSFSNTNSLSTSEDKRTRTSIGVYAQKYFPITEKFMVTLIGGISYGVGTNWSKSTDSFGATFEDEDKFNNVAVALGPSFVFLLSQHWALQLRFGNISYSIENSKSDDTMESSFNMNYSISGLGVVYYFRAAQ